MPKRRAAWSCWNYLTHSAVDKFGNKKANIDQVTLYVFSRDIILLTPFTDPILSSVHVSNAMLLAIVSVTIVSRRLDEQPTAYL